MADIEPDKRWHQRFLDDGTATLYVDTYDGELGRATAENVRKVAKAVGSAANAAVNGAYSVFPDTFNYPRSILRGAGVLGKDEAYRFDQEMAAMGEGAKQIARHPKLAAEAAGRAFWAGWDPLILPYLAGRGAMGYFTGLGPFALVGGVLRAAENADNFIDPVLYGGIQGRPPPGGLPGIPPEGRGLLGIPPQEPR
jgi:hypothetical protein